MERLKEHFNDYRNSGYDLVAEAFIAVLIKQEEIESSVFFSPNGGFSRNYTKDINKIVGPFEDNKQLPFTVVELNRKGLYDTLPEGLFHQSREKKAFKSIDELKETFQENNQIEQDVRKFFWPIDHEILALRSAVFANEESQLVHILSASQKEGLKKFWNLPSFLSAKTQGELFLLLPLSHKISSRPRLIQQVFELILGVPVALQKMVVREKSSSFHSVQLSQLSLGINSILGRQVENYEQAFHMKIGPIGKEEASRFAPGEYKDKVLKCLIDFFIPCDMNTSFDILILDEDKELYLDSNNTRLGITSFLNERT